MRLLDDESRLEETHKETIYRVVQESLSNAVRHGRPNHIEVAVTAEADGLIQTRIRDDGMGKAAPGSGFGLIGMRERVAASGGTLTIDKSPVGWTVTARLPAASVQSFERTADLT